MICWKRYLLVLVLLLLIGLTFSVCRPSIHTMPPPGIPEDWQHYKEPFGRFEIWLPEGWEGSGQIPILIYQLRQVAVRSPSPRVLFTARGDKLNGYSQWIEIVSYDGVRELFVPLTGKDLARECSRINPVELTLDLTETVCPDDSSITITEVQGGMVAYQSKVLDQYKEYNLARTVACIVSPDHVYLVYLDTIEPSEGPRTYEMILKGLRVFK